MKILVISDTHGREANLKLVLEREGAPDCLIHLGDSENREKKIRTMVECPSYIVAGNCDFFSRLPNDAVVKLEGHRIFITHGHSYFVDGGIKDLAAAAKMNKCDIAMFGHTHRPMLDQSDPELTILNPGSLSYPRQEGRKPSYMLVTLEEGKPVIYEKKFL